MNWNSNERRWVWWQDRGCGRWDEAISLAALGLLEDDARRDLDHHLHQCPRCAARMESARGAASDLCAAAKAVEVRGADVVSPSAGLRERWTSVVRRSGRSSPSVGLNGRTSPNLEEVPEVMDEGRGILRLGMTVWGWIRRGDWVWAASAAVWMLAMLLRVAAPGLERGEVRAVPRTTLSWREVRMVLDQAQFAGWGDRSEERGADVGAKPSPAAPARMGPRSDAGVLRING